jgi:hypothetical protein
LAAGLDRVSLAASAIPDLVALAAAVQLLALPAGPDQVRLALPANLDQDAAANLDQDAPAAVASLDQDAAEPESAAKPPAAVRLEALQSLEDVAEAVQSDAMGEAVVPANLGQVPRVALAGPGQVYLGFLADPGQDVLGLVERLDGLAFQERHRMEVRYNTRWRYELMPFYLGGGLPFPFLVSTYLSRLRKPESPKTKAVML